MVQNLQVKVEELKSVKESLNLWVEELSKAGVLAEATLREIDKLISDQCKKMRLLEEQSEPFYEIKRRNNKLIFLKKENGRFGQKMNFLKKVSSSVQKEYNDLLASNDVMKQRLEMMFKFLKHDNTLDKMIEMTEKENESKISKISITISILENKNLELVKKMRDKIKCFDEEKKVFEIKILKLEKVLAQRIKYFDDVK
nr:hypothetical protein [Tanacetum cinerariifolium]